MKMDIIHNATNTLVALKIQKEKDMRISLKLDKDLMIVRNRVHEAGVEIGNLQRLIQTTMNDIVDESSKT